MADILARWIFFMLDIMWVVLVLVPLWLLYAIAAILYELTAWSIFYRIAKVTEKLQFKSYTIIRYISTTWLTEEDLSKIEQEPFGKDD